MEVFSEVPLYCTYVHQVEILLILYLVKKGSKISNPKLSVIERFHCIHTVPGFQMEEHQYLFLITIISWIESIEGRRAGGGRVEGGDGWGSVGELNQTLKHKWQCCAISKRPILAQLTGYKGQVCG